MKNGTRELVAQESNSAFENKNHPSNIIGLEPANQNLGLPLTPIVHPPIRHLEISLAAIEPDLMGWCLQLNALEELVRSRLSTKGTESALVTPL